ncbi:MAG: hypothetical protein H6618_06645 [Deltaproteobacteria bacterium]|nr:hypothetical protein [Deltaproteobacteria bacterium]
MKFRGWLFPGILAANAYQERIRGKSGISRLLYNSYLFCHSSEPQQKSRSNFGEVLRFFITHKIGCRIFLLFMLSGSVQSCTFLSDFLPQKTGYDRHRVMVQTLNLFNQRSATDHSDLLFMKGNWLFRRQRINEIDGWFRQIYPPDLLIFQEVMKRQGSLYESDRHLLGSGALSGYKWQTVNLTEYEDTGEQETMAVATSLAAAADSEEGPKPLFWNIAPDSYLVAFQVLLEKQPFMVVNIDLKDGPAAQGSYYHSVRDRIREALRIFGLCSERMIIAGYFGGSENQDDYQDMLSALSLRDTAIGFCWQEADCYTEDSSGNPLFLKVQGDVRPKRNIRILVHQMTHVYTAGRNFDRAVPWLAGSEMETTPFVPPAPYAGWQASIRLPLCADTPIF